MKKRNVFLALLIIIGSAISSGTFNRGSGQLVNVILNKIEYPLVDDMRLGDLKGGAKDGVAVWYSEKSASVLVFVSDIKKNEIEVWNATTGNKVRTLKGFTELGEVAVDQKRNMVYVIDKGEGKIKKIDIKNIEDNEVNAVAEFGNEFVAWEKPQSLEVSDAQSEVEIFTIYEGKGEWFVRIFDETGVLKEEWKLNGAGGSVVPDGVNGRVYVVDKQEGSLKVYNELGEETGEVGKGILTKGVEDVVVYNCGREGYLFISDRDRDEVMIVDRLNLEVLGSVKVDGVINPGRLAQTTHSFGSYAKGMLFIESDHEYVTGVSWEKMRDSLGVTVCGESSNTESKHTTETQVPSAPRYVKVEKTNDEEVRIIWEEVEDIDVVGYVIFRDGVQIGQTNRTLYYDLNASSSDTHTYEVATVNLAGNYSPKKSVIQPVAARISDKSEENKTDTKKLEEKQETSARTEVSQEKNDSRPPKMSNVQMKPQSSSTAKVSWATDEPSYFLIEYGKNPEYDVTVSGFVKDKKHTFLIDGLEVGTMYHYRIVSRDESGNISSITGTYEHSASYAGAPKVTALPKGGMFENEVVITLRAEKGAKVYYTVDGSDPNESSSEYKGDIILKSTSIVKFKAITQNGEQSAINQEIYEITSSPTNEQVINTNLISPKEVVQIKARYENSQSQWNTRGVAVYVGKVPEEAILFAVNKGKARIDMWNIQGNNFLGSLVGLMVPKNIAVDEAEGALYVVDTGSYDIKKYTLEEIKKGNSVPTSIVGGGFKVSREPVDVTVYRESGISYVFATYTGNSEKYVRKFNTNGVLEMEKNVGYSKLETIVADDENQVMYVSDEGNKVIKVIKPDGTLLQEFGKGIFEKDPEGLDVYECREGQGYIVVSDHGVNNFKIFNRKTFAYLGKFEIYDVVGAQSMVIANIKLRDLPEGMLFAESKDSFVTGVDWEKIRSATGMTLCF